MKSAVTVTPIILSDSSSLSDSSGLRLDITGIFANDKCMQSEQQVTGTRKYTSSTHAKLSLLSGSVLGVLRAAVSVSCVMAASRGT